MSIGLSYSGCSATVLIIPAVRALTSGEARQVATASYPGDPTYGATHVGGL